MNAFEALQKAVDALQGGGYDTSKHDVDAPDIWPSAEGGQKVWNVAFRIPRSDEGGYHFVIDDATGECKLRGT